MVILVLHVNIRDKYEISYLESIHSLLELPPPAPPNVPLPTVLGAKLAGSSARSRDRLFQEAGCISELEREALEERPCQTQP